MISDSEDEPTLSAETLRALEEFRQEQKQAEEADRATSSVPENWQLSQFWYDEATCRKLAAEVLDATHGRGWIACISCPSLYKALMDFNLETCDAENPSQLEEPNVFLYEHDVRFQATAGKDFVMYDYNTPFDVPEDHHGKFSYIALDPPFLSEECLRKTAQTVELLKNDGCKILLCTGEIMGESAGKLLGVTPTEFFPVHKSKLSNTFRSYTNYHADVLNGTDH